MLRILKKLPLIGVTFTIIYLSINSGPVTPPLFPHIDKLNHFLAYSALGFSIYLATSNKRYVKLYVTLSLILGLSLEYIQGQLPYRHMSFADGLANILGVGFGILFYQSIRSLYKKKILIT